MNKQLEKEIPCSICYKKYKNIANHIRKHEISAEEYRKKYGETTYTRIIIKKINKLFVSERSKWLCGYYAKKEDQLSGGYRTYDSQKAINGKYAFNDKLNDSHISRHLRFEHLVGVFFPKGHTSMFCFDVDVQGEGNSYTLAQPIVSNIVNELAKYFSTKDIHVVFSGQKGYHIWLFFSCAVRTWEILSFAQSITKWNKGNCDVNIEFRPESDDSRSIKLPLGQHVKTRKFCCFVDKETFKPVENSYEYLMTIQQIIPIDFFKFVDKDQPRNRVVDYTYHPKQNLEFNEEQIDKVYKMGLPRLGTRNYYTFFIAILLKEKYGLSQDEAVSELMNWTENEFQNYRTKDNAVQSQGDILGTVKNVYEKGYLLFGSIKLTAFEESIIPFITIKSKKITQRDQELCQRKEECFRQILILGKFWNRRGFFFISKPYLAKKLGCSERTITTYLEEFSRSCLIFRPVLGKNKKEFYEEMCAAAEPYMKIPVFKEWFENQQQPKEGYNSLYYFPFFSNKLKKEYNNILDISDLNYQNLALFGAAKCWIACGDGEDVLFKYNMIIEGKRRADLSELKEFIKQRKNIRNKRGCQAKDEYETFTEVIKLIEPYFYV